MVSERVLEAAAWSKSARRLEVIAVFELIERKWSSVFYY